mgnify:CR=1 FL=1
MDISFWQITLITTTGFISGIINTLAGGGSNLTLPALMVLGMPPEVANATNRVGVLLQSMVGVFGFKRHDRLPTHDIVPILLLVLPGGLIGAIIAAYSPSTLLKPLLLGTMVVMAAIILIRPNIICPPPNTPPNPVGNNRSAWFWLFLSGLYGGFVQAGVGFMLITALAGSLRYDLVRTNALKLVCTSGFTVVALVIFIANDQVLWMPGLILAVGAMGGTHFAVKFAIKANPDTLKWLLFIMTLCASTAALLF